MMKTALYYLPLIATASAALAGCSVASDEDDVFSTSDLLVCDTSADCPANLECELEHGESFCKPHGGDDGTAASGGATADAPCATDSDCPAGLECELEHGASFCKPHGGDGGSDPNAATCQSDADCPAGEECELEHGEAFCKPHDE